MLPRRLTERPAAVAATATLAIATMLSVPPPVAAVDPASLAAEQLAHDHGGTAADYRVVHQRTASVPRSGESVWVGKLVGPDGQIYTVSREPNGRIAGGEVVAERAREAIAALVPLVAKADDALRSRIARARTGERVPAAVWLTADTSGAVAAVHAAHPDVEWIDGHPVPRSLEEARALRAELYDARAGAYAAAEAELSRALVAIGGDVGYASSSAPLAFVDVPASAVGELANLPIVESLGLERSWRPMMTSAGPTVDANWTSGSGDQGNGVRVAVVEYHNVRNSGDLGGRVVASHSSSGTLAYATGATFDHPTWVAGAIAGGGSYPGVAPGARIVSASTGGGTAGLARDRAVIATTDWAISPGGGDADIVNLSLVQDTTTGSEEARRYFDSVVDEDLRLVVAAAGNHSALGTWQVGSPGTGWNVLTVGGIDDRNTAGRSDNRIWYGSDGSSYVDPPGTAWNAHGDFNKPNLSAPAVSVRTANGLGGTGTSVATPIVSGIAAQILARAPTLASWPEGARAVLMAGAVYHTRMPDGSINADHEGTGSASALWSNRLLTVGDGTYGGYRIGSMSGTFSRQIHVAGGQRVRVVLAWNSRTSGTSNLAKTDTLASDLDLRVRLPNGATYSSYTFDNNYEVVDVVSPVAGDATIQVLGTRVGSGGERYGLAWAKIGGDITPPAVTQRAPESGEPWAAAATDPTATFSEPVTGVNGASAILRITGDGTVPATVAYWAAGRRLTIAPQSPLDPGSYTVTLTGAIRDVAGNPLPTQSWSFTVVDSEDVGTAVLSPLRRVAFGAGTTIGYQFDGEGNVVGNRAGTLSKPSGASADRRGTIAGQPGHWLRMANGAWDGYWIRESPLVHVPGTIQEDGLPGTTRVWFAPGTHIGYRFSSDGSITARHEATLGRASGANTNGRAIINGSTYLSITNGAWAGYWIPESSSAFVAGMHDHHDLMSRTVRFSAGTFTGRTFAPNGVALTARTAKLASASSAPAIAWAVIGGAPRYLIGAGAWAGTWVSESTSVRAP